MSRFWQKLEPGDIVDVIAPASSSTKRDLRAAIRFVEDFGLTPRLPKRIFGRDDLICSNTDEKRFAHLKKALKASDSKAIWCLRGGYGSNRLLPRLSRLKPPMSTKLFIGYSDITALHCYLNHFWDWPTVHGSMLEGLGRGEGGRRELRELRKLIFGLEKEMVYDSLVPLNAAARKRKTVKGRIYGGNLAVLNGLLGTPWQCSLKGGILVIEDIGERGYRVDRMLFQMKSAGCFKGLRALIFGDFVGGAEDDGAFLWKEVQRLFAKECSFPVLKGLPCGHGVFQRPIAFNTPSTLELGRWPELFVKSGFRS